MIAIGLMLSAIAVSIAGYGVVKRSKKIEDLNLRVQSMSISMF